MLRVTGSEAIVSKTRLRIVGKERPMVELVGVVPMAKIIYSSHTCSSSRTNGPPK